MHGSNSKFTVMQLNTVGKVELIKEGPFAIA